MFNNKIVLFFFAFVLSALPRLAYAECLAKFDKVAHVYDDFENYHALQQVDAKKELLISVVNSNNCQLHVVLSSENQTQLKSQFQSFPYQIKSDQSQLMSSSSLKFELIENSVKLTLNIVSGTPVKAGIYNDRLTLKLYDKSNQLLDEKEYEIEENITPKTSLSVIGYNTSANMINIGELISGKLYNMLPSLQVVTNSDIQLSLSSENNGKLIHSEFKNKYSINYSLNFAGNWFELNTPSTHSFSYNGQTVFLLPLKIQLSDFERQAAGEYSDTIRFQISPLNY